MEGLYREALERAARRSPWAWCYAAARGLGDVLAHAIRLRSTHPSPLTRTHTMESTIHDVRLAVRSLVRAPGFTLVAIGTLALGIGANASIFSLINAVLLRAPAHVERPDRLVSVYTSDFSGPPFGTSSHPDFRDFRAESPALADAIALTPGTVTVPGSDGVSEILVTEFVTGNYFELLGVQPALGRSFTDEEGDHSSGAAVTVLSHGFWLRRFGGDPDVVGETFRVSGQPVTIVGVAPEGFGGMLPLVTPDLWIPPSTQALINEGGGNFEARGDRSSYIFARLADGSTIDVAQEQLNAVARRLHQRHPDWWTDVNGEARRVTVVDDIRLPPQIRGAATGFALLLLTAVGIVLLIVCANVANLTLARVSRRGRELAVKAALGAGRTRIMRQLLAEGAIVGGLGGLGGLALAAWLLGIARALRPFTGVSMSLDLGVDRNVLLFSAVVTTLTVLAVGLIPALRASRPDLVPALKRGSGDGSRRFRWLEPRHLLVVSQVSASLVLLVGAGLFLKSMRAAIRVDPGFTVDGIAMLRIDLMDLVREGYSPEEVVGFMNDVEARAARLPGVVATSTADALPMTLGAAQRSSVSIPGYERAAGEDMEFQFHSVGPGFMTALGMEVLVGREFTDADNQDAEPVLMVNETFAERFWPGESPVGKLVTYRGQDMPVVGLVRDAMYRSLTDQDRPAFFIPLEQNLSPNFTLFARTASGDAAELLPMLRDEVARMDPRIPVATLQTMEDAVAFTLLPQRIASWLLSVAGGLGLLLAAIGLYGVMSLLVTQRTREVGIRIALGAETRHVVRMIVGRGLALTAVGAVIGLSLAAFATRFARSFLFDVSPVDVSVFASMTVAALAVAGLATWVPARRASGVDPMVSLRHE